MKWRTVLAPGSLLAAFFQVPCLVTLVLLGVVITSACAQQPVERLPKANAAGGKIYILHMMHIEPETPWNRNHFNGIVDGIEKLFAVAESHGHKITIHSEMKFAVSAPGYGIADFKLAEKRGHEFATHVHEFPIPGKCCDYDGNSTLAETYDAMYPYMQQRMKAMDAMVDHNETICGGQLVWKDTEFSRRASLVSYRVSRNLGFRLAMGLHVDFCDDIKKWSVPHRPSYDDMSIEDPESSTVFISGCRDMAKLTRYPDKKGGEMATENFAILQGIFDRVYLEFKSDPSKDYVFVDCFHCWASAANSAQKAAGIANYDKYLSYFDPYVATGEAESVTARELAAIVLRE